METLSLLFVPPAKGGGMEIKMNCKISFIVILIILLVGCGSVDLTNTKKEKTQLSASNYVKKIWIITPDKKRELNDVNISFFVESIDANGNIIGKISSDGFIDDEINSVFKGKLINGIGECQFTTQNKNKGYLQLNFKSQNEINAVIEVISKSESKKQLFKDYFDFMPDNINKIDGLKQIEEHSFMTYINLWGDVKFVSAYLTAGHHIPLVFYLTNKEGDIFYEFVPEIPYKMKIQDISIEDVNYDGLKDIIVILFDYDVKGKKCQYENPVIFLQKNNGIFEEKLKLEKEVGESKNNQSIESIKNYLNKKWKEKK